METNLEEAEWLQTYFEQLNFIEEKRINAICHAQLYQKRLKKAFEKNVHPEEFQDGDLMLKKILSNQKDRLGKWTPNYEGPYVVKKAFSRGALFLINMDEKDLSCLVNFDVMRKYYAYKNN